MFKGTLIAGTVVANADIPLTQLLNTNNKVNLSNNTLQMKTSGLWEINANINFTAVGTSTTAQLFMNGNAIPYTDITITTESGNNYEISLQDIERLRYSNISDYADYSIRFTSAVTITGGNVLLSYKC